MKLQILDLLSYLSILVRIAQDIVGERLSSNSRSRMEGSAQLVNFQTQQVAWRRITSRADGGTEVCSKICSVSGDTVPF